MLIITRIILVLSEEDTFGINGSFVAPEKKSLVLTLVKQKQNLHYNGDNSYLFVNGKKNL